MLLPRNIFTLILYQILISIISPIVNSTSLGSTRNPIVIERQIHERDDEVQVVDLKDALKLYERQNQITDLRTVIASGDAKQFLGFGKNSGISSKTIISLVKVPLSREEQCPQQQEEWLMALKEAKDRTGRDHTTDELLKKGVISECVKSAILWVTYKEKNSRKSTKLIVDLQITIKDVNNNAPEFVDQTQEIRISEGTQVGRTFKLSSANDADLPPNHIKRYYMSSTSAKCKDFFSVETEEQRLDGTLIPLLKLKKKLDRETAETYEFKLVAEDGHTIDNMGEINSKTGSGKGEMTVKIVVLDENDNAPIFDEKKPMVKVDETAKKGTKIWTAVASDADGENNNQITYSIVKTNTNKLDYDAFTIDPQTGEVSVRKALTSITRYNTNRHLYIRAEDNGKTKRESTVLLTVQIQDKNDELPKIEVQFLESQIDDNGEEIYGYMENRDPEDPVAIVTCSDNDGSQPTCRIKQADEGASDSFAGKDDAELFMLEMEYTKSKTTVYNLRTTKTFDRELKDLYYITIVASDGSDPPQEVEEIVEIRILDRNDNPPRFLKRTRTISLKENQKAGSLPVTKLEAEDEDIGIGATLQYYFEKTAKMTDVNGNTREIQSKNMPIGTDSQGSLILIREMQAEKVRQFEVNAVVEDGYVQGIGTKSMDDSIGDLEGMKIAHTDTQKLIFNILDVNEYAPRFNPQSKGAGNKFVFSIKENSPERTPLGKISAKDIDRDSDIIFEIDRTSFDPPLSVNQQIPFEIGPLTPKEWDGEVFTQAQITVKRSLDRETQGTYQFQIRALDNNRSGPKDCADHGCVSVIDVTVNVLDENDNSPELCANRRADNDYCATDKTKLNLKFCNATRGAMIANIDARDIDAGLNGELEIRITKQKRKWDSDDNDSLKLFEMSKADATQVQLTRDLQESDVGPYLISVEVSDLSESIDDRKTTKGIINLYVNSVKKPLNETQASLAFEKRPDILARISISAAGYYRQTEAFIASRGIPQEFAIVFMILVFLLVAIIMALMVWCCHSCGICKCCNCCCSSEEQIGGENIEDLEKESFMKQGFQHGNRNLSQSNQPLTQTYSGLMSNYNTRNTNQVGSPIINGTGIPANDPTVLEYDNNQMMNTYNAGLMQQNSNGNNTGLEFGINTNGYNTGLGTANFNSRGGMYNNHETATPLLQMGGNPADFYTVNNNDHSNHGTFKRPSQDMRQTGQNVASGNSSGNNHTQNTSPGGQSNMSPEMAMPGHISNYNANFQQTLETPMGDGQFDYQQHNNDLPAPPQQVNPDYEQYGGNLNNGSKPGQHTTFGV